MQKFNIGEIVKTKFTGMKKEGYIVMCMTGQIFVWQYSNQAKTCLRKWADVLGIELNEIVNSNIYMKVSTPIS